MNDKVSKNEVIAVLNDLLDKWKNVKVRRFIVNQELEFNPVFISIDLKKVIEINILSENGGLLRKTDDTDESIKSTSIGYCVTVGVGDLKHEKTNGLGVGYRTDMTSLKLNVLKKNLSKSIDSAFKVALSQYFNHHAEISEFKKIGEFQKFSEESPANYYDEEKELSLDLSLISSIMERADESLLKNKKIKQSRLELDITKENRWFISFEKRAESKENRNNIFTSDIYGSFTFSIETKDKEGGDIKFYDVKKWEGPENFEKNVNSLKESLDKLANKFYKAPVLDSGLYRTVLSPEATYTVFHEGFGAHLASAKLIDEAGATAFKAKLGHKILPDTLTIIDDPTIEGLFGTYRFDEEGQPAQKVVLVEKGILKNYLYDRISAGRHNVKSNGHARAQFGEIPEPRTANMIIKSDKTRTEKELIEIMKSDCKRHNEPFGLYINGRSGEVEADSGQFKVYASEFYKIYTDGKIEPVSNAFIVGDPYMTLNQVKLVGDNQTECIGQCGSESGNVKVGGICPSIYFRKIEIHSSGEYPEADSLIDEENEDDNN